MKVRSARTGSMCGHTGNKLNERVKYSGRANSFCTPSASAARRNSSHTGDETKEKIPDARWKRLTQCNPFAPRRRACCRFP